MSALENIFSFIHRASENQLPQWNFSLTGTSSCELSWLYFYLLLIFLATQLLCGHLGGQFGGMII